MDVEKDKWECCDSCRLHKPDVYYRLDPYAEDVLNEEHWLYLCDYCTEQRAADI